MNSRYAAAKLAHERAFPPFPVTSALGTALLLLTGRLVQYPMMSLLHVPTMPFSAYVRGHLWRTPSAVLTAWLNYQVCLLLVRASLMLARRLSSGTVGSIATTSGWDIGPQIAQIEDRTDWVFFASYLILDVFGFALFLMAQASLFWVLLAYYSAAMAAVFYIAIVRSQHMGRWALYRFRSVIMRHAMVMVPALLLATCVGGVCWHLFARLGFLGEFPIEFIPDAARTDCTFIISKLSSLGSMPLRDIAAAAICSAVLAQFIIWALTVILKREYSQLVLLVLPTVVICVAPSLDSVRGLLEQTGMQGAAPVVLGVAILLIIDRIGSILRNTLGSRVTCVRCEERIGAADLHCKYCGARNVVAET